MNTLVTAFVTSTNILLRLYALAIRASILSSTLLVLFIPLISCNLSFKNISLDKNCSVHRINMIIKIKDGQSRLDVYT